MPSPIHNPKSKIENGFHWITWSGVTLPKALAGTAFRLRREWRPAHYRPGGPALTLGGTRISAVSTWTDAEVQTRTPSPTICVANEGVGGLSSDPIQGHLQALPAGRTVSEVKGMHGLYAE
jgi:hypothetical protein